MTEAYIGVVSPGEMGAAVGRSLVGCGRRVVSVLAGRSPDTVGRAEEAGIAPVEDLGALVTTAGVIVSVVPPAEAGDVASRLAEAILSTRSTPLVVEANAISPGRAEELARMLEGAGAAFVDGDLIGAAPGPDRPPTRLYLSGPHASRAADVLRTDELRPVVLQGPATAASSLKMAYASWTKGSAALVLAARALARRLGVEDALLGEWASSQPASPSAASQRLVDPVGAGAMSPRWRRSPPLRGNPGCPTASAAPRQRRSGGWPHSKAKRRPRCSR